MNRYKSMENKEQISLMPICMDDMITPDCEVRAIDAIVDKMDIQSIGFTYSETKETGRKPYSSVEMFKLYATATLMVYVHLGKSNGNAIEILK